MNAGEFDINMRCSNVQVRKEIINKTELYFVCINFMMPTSFGALITPCYLSRARYLPEIDDWTYETFPDDMGKLRLTSAAICASIKLLNMANKIVLVASNDHDPTWFTRGVVHGVAKQYNVDPSEMMAFYPRIKEFLKHPSIKVPETAEELQFMLSGVENVAQV